MELFSTISKYLWLAGSKYAQQMAGTFETNSLHMIRDDPSGSGTLLCLGTLSTPEALLDTPEPPAWGPGRFGVPTLRVPYRPLPESAIRSPLTEQAARVENYVVTFGIGLGRERG